MIIDAAGTLQFYRFSNNGMYDFRAWNEIGAADLYQMHDGSLS